MIKRLPRYPVYIPSKGRAEKCYTAQFMFDDGVPFYLVVEEQISPYRHIAAADKYVEYGLRRIGWQHIFEQQGQSKRLN